MLKFMNFKLGFLRKFGENANWMLVGWGSIGLEWVLMDAKLWQELK
jgi:hypothetical protein